MPPTNDRRATWLTVDRLALGGLLAFTLIVRGGVLWAMRANLEQDPDAYREIAENLLRHGEFALGKGNAADPEYQPAPTAYRPPLYPVVLSNLPTTDRQHISLFKVAVLHLALGVATVWLTWLTTRRLLRRVGPATEGRAGPPHNDIIGGPAPARAGLSHPTVQMVGTAHPTIAPLVAGFVVACDPILLNQQTLVMTETLAAFLAILSLWCLARFDASRSWFNAALAGGAIGLAVLCRPTFLPWLGMVALAMLLIRGRNSEFRIQNSEFRWLEDFGWRIANLAGLAIAASAIISPWAIRNYRVFGKPIVTTTHGGYTFLLGNNYLFYDWLKLSTREEPWGAPFSLTNGFGSPHEFSTGLSDLTDANAGELKSDSHCYEYAFQCVRDRRTAFIRACFYRLGQLWSALPHKLTTNESTGRRLLRYATCAWYCGVYLLAAIGTWRISGGSVGKPHPTAMFQPPWIWGVLLCFAFTAVHTFYWTNLRMRAPLMPFVALVAAAAISTSPKRERG
jgi:hypothetical protein